MPNLDRWPKLAFENILKASGLGLSGSQIKGVSVLVAELVDKFMLQVGDEDEPEEDDR